MAKINTLKTIEKTKQEISSKYNISVESLIAIRNSEKDVYDLIQNGFIFGYAQGLKAAKAQMKGGVA